jgi:hypothetical protein
MSDTGDVPMIDKKPRGRPPLDPDEGMTHYVYVRMPKALWDKLEDLAARNGFRGRGHISTTVRWCLERMHSLSGGSR